MARKTAIWPKCEVCGENATACIVDNQEGPPQRSIDRETGKPQWWQTWSVLAERWFCPAHKRAPVVKKLTDQERARFMARSEGLSPVG